MFNFIKLYNKLKEDMAMFLLPQYCNVKDIFIWNQT